MVATEQLESTRLLADGIRAFLQRVVVPLQQEHTAVLENSRRLYDEDGRYAREVRELMRSVRARSSAAGYYTAFVPEVRGPLLPDLISGEKTMCLGISEPDAGTDIWNMKTTAIARDGGWVLNGTKQWITNSPYASYVIVFAVTEPHAFARRRGGISTLLVECARPGFTVDS